MNKLITKRISKNLMHNHNIKSSSVLLSRPFSHGEHLVSPPFVVRSAPKSSLPEMAELIWDDPYAPETAIDFDVQHISTGKALLIFMCGIGFFGLIAGLVKIYNPSKHKRAISRSLPIQDKYITSYPIGVETLPKAPY